MTTKIERADILLDAVGFIGEDIIAESSGISSVLPIPSKLRLNMIIMRRLLAATLGILLLSALTPLSVYLYGQITNPNPAVTVAPESTEEPEEITEPPEVIRGAAIDSLTSAGDMDIRDLFHEAYEIKSGGELKTYDFRVSDRGNVLVRSICPALFRDRDTDEWQLYLDVRNIRGEIVTVFGEAKEFFSLIPVHHRRYLFSIFILQMPSRCSCARSMTSAPSSTANSSAKTEVHQLILI